MHKPEPLSQSTTDGPAECSGANEPKGVFKESSERPLSVGEGVLNQTTTAIDDCCSNKDDTDNIVRSDPLRFVVLVLFSFLSLTNAMQWIAFSSIVDEVREYFHMSAAEVNMLSTIYVISYTSIVFLSCKMYELAGVRNTLIIAALFNTIGGGIKLIALYAWPNSALLFIAQAVNSITEVLVIATPPLIANRWFSRKKRGVANTIMSSAMNIGSGVGVLVPTFFVGPGMSSKRDFAKFFWSNFAVCMLVLVLIVFFIPRRPRYSASFTARIMQKREDTRLNWRKSFHAGEAAVANTPPSPQPAPELKTSARECGEVAPAERPFEAEKNPSVVGPKVDSHLSLDGIATDKVDPVNVFSVLVDCYRACRRSTSLVLLIITSATELGLLWSMETVLPQVFKPYGISEAMTGWISFTNLVLGTVVCPFMMPLVYRFNSRYKLILSGTALVLTVDLILITLLLYFGPQHGGEKYYTWVMFVCWGILAGVCQNFTMPLMFEYVVELTFPMAESTSAPMLMWSACTMNLILTLIFGAVLTDNPDKGKSLIIFISSIVISFSGALAVILTKSQHKRQNYEIRKFLEQEALLNSDKNERVVA